MAVEDRRRGAENTLVIRDEKEIRQMTSADATVNGEWLW
jgi:hypothetical protein